MSNNNELCIYCKGKLNIPPTDSDWITRLKEVFNETDSLKSLHERVEDFVQIERYKAVNEYQTIMGLDIRSN